MSLIWGEREARKIREVGRVVVAKDAQVRVLVGLSVPSKEGIELD